MQYESLGGGGGRKEERREGGGLLIRERRKKSLKRERERNEGKLAMESGLWRYGMGIKGLELTGFDDEFREKTEENEEGKIEDKNFFA